MNKSTVKQINEDSKSPIKLRLRKRHGNHMQHRRHKPYRRTVKPVKFAKIIKPSSVGVVE